VNEVAMDEDELERQFDSSFWLVFGLLLLVSCALPTWAHWRRVEILKSGWFIDDS